MAASPRTHVPGALDETLETDRLVLLPLDGVVVRRRLAAEDFAISLPLLSGSRLVHFTSSWPGDLLPLFSLWAPELGEDQWSGQWIMAGRGSWQALGVIGLKGVPAGGSVEIGYGVIPEAEGLGLATEAVAAVVAALLVRDDVDAVTAETAVGNRASARVLTKAGFDHVGTAHRGDDDHVDLWQF